MITKLLKILQSYQISPSSEEDLHDALEDILSWYPEIPSFVREYRLDSKNRFDLFCEEGGVVIEIKVDGSRSALLRQIHRYAGLKAVRTIIVVTTVTNHVRNSPREISGKPIHYALVGGWL